MSIQQRVLEAKISAALEHADDKVHFVDPGKRAVVCVNRSCFLPDLSRNRLVLLGELSDEWPHAGQAGECHGCGDVYYSPKKERLDKKD